MKQVVHRQGLDRHEPVRCQHLEIPNRARIARKRLIELPGPCDVAGEVVADCRGEAHRFRVECVESVLHQLNETCVAERIRYEWQSGHLLHLITEDRDEDHGRQRDSGGRGERPPFLRQDRSDDTLRLKTPTNEHTDSDSPERERRRPKNVGRVVKIGDVIERSDPVRLRASEVLGFPLCSHGVAAVLEKLRPDARGELVSLRQTGNLRSSHR